MLPKAPLGDTKPTIGIRSDPFAESVAPPKHLGRAPCKTARLIGCSGSPEEPPRAPKASRRTLQ